MLLDFSAVWNCISRLLLWGVRSWPALCSAHILLGLVHTDIQHLYQHPKWRNKSRDWSGAREVLPLHSLGCSAAIYWHLLRPEFPVLTLVRPYNPLGAGTGKSGIFPAPQRAEKADSSGQWKAREEKEILPPRGLMEGWALLGQGLNPILSEAFPKWINLGFFGPQQWMSPVFVCVYSSENLLLAVQCPHAWKKEPSLIPYIHHSSFQERKEHSPLPGAVKCSFRYLILWEQVHK